MNVWLTTEQVKEHYGFDPSPYGERHAAGDNFVRNQLRLERCCRCIGWRTVWLQEDVERQAPRERAREKERWLRAEERRITSQYTKGLRR